MNNTTSQDPVRATAHSNGDLCTMDHPPGHTNCHYEGAQEPATPITSFLIARAAVPGVAPGKTIRLNNQDYRITEVLEHSPQELDLRLEPIEAQADPSKWKGRRHPVIRQPGRDTLEIPRGCTDEQLEAVLFNNAIVEIQRSQPTLCRREIRARARGAAKAQRRQILEEIERLKQEDQKHA